MPRMKYNLLLIILLMVVLVIYGFKFTNAKTIIGFFHPESVCQHKNFIYVSNVGGWEKDDGFITKLDEYGHIIEYKYIDGLKSPKGIYAYDNKLYIADVNRICIADLKKEDKKSCTTIKNAKFLNDLVVKNSEVYVTDTLKDCIFKMDKNGKVNIFFSQLGLSPNGITFSHKLNAFIVVSFNKPVINIISLNGKLIKAINVKKFDGFDGIFISKNDIYLSDYKKGLVIKTTFNMKHFDVIKHFQANVADIYLKGNIIFVPLISKNKLALIKVIN